VCEILSLKQPAIIVPRTAPRKEQLIRATMLSGRGLVQMIHPRDLAPAHLLDSVHELMTNPVPNRPSLAMDGLGNMTQALGSLHPHQAWWPETSAISA
jgi:predicted glycosyltransferase